MHVKILMCPCYRENFQSEGNVWIKHLINFHCKCPAEHEHFVQFCEHHPLGKSIPSIRDYTGTERKKCLCSIIYATEICQFCVTVRYTLNFNTYKFCLEDSDFTRFFLKEKRCVPLNEYLSKSFCNPFWYFDYSQNRIFVSLENPIYIVPKRTAFRLV